MQIAIRIILWKHLIRCKKKLFLSMSCDQKSLKTLLWRGLTLKDRLVGMGRSLWPAYWPWLILLLDEIKLRAEYSNPGVRRFLNPATKSMKQLWKWKAKKDRQYCVVARAPESDKPEFYSPLWQSIHRDLRLFTPFAFLSPSFLIYKNWGGMGGGKTGESSKE